MVEVFQYIDEDLFQREFERRLVGLGWRPEHHSRVDGRMWLLPNDLVAFVSESQPDAWQEIRRRTGGDLPAREALCAAVHAEMSRVSSAARVLLKGVSVDGVAVNLWNAFPRFGLGSDETWGRNRFSVVREATFTYEGAISVSRRPDVTLWVNGLCVGLWELKLPLRGQSASVEGRGKVADDFLDFAAAALSDAGARWKCHLKHWKNWPEAARAHVRAAVMPYLAANHVAACDPSEVLSTSDMSAQLPRLQRAISEDSALTTKAREFARAEIVGAMGRLPDSPLRRAAGMSWLDYGLECLCSPRMGIDMDAVLFFDVDRKLLSEGSPPEMSVVRPRTAQRGLVFWAARHILAELAAGDDAEALASATREACLHLAPGASEAEVERAVRERMLARNSRDIIGCLLQAATGVGKSRIMLWLARLLSGLRSPDGGKAFGTCIIITDRRELIRNISKEASTQQEMGGGLAVPSSSRELMECIRKGGLVAVTIQMMDSLLSGMSEGDKDLLRNGPRVAFIIDEVHRSQDGDMNRRALESFDSICATLSERAARPNRRNLVVGLTATPSETTVSRLGWFMPTSLLTDIGAWQPHATYSFQNSFDDGICLPVTKGPFHVLSVVTREGTPWEGADTASLRHAGPERIYRNKERAEAVAEKMVKLYAELIMSSISEGRARRENDEKRLKEIYARMLVTCHDVPSLHVQARALKKALRRYIARNRHRLGAHVISALEKLRLITLFSKSEVDPGDVQGCTTFDALNAELNADLEGNPFRPGMGEDETLREFHPQPPKDGERRSDVPCILIVVNKCLTGFDCPSLSAVCFVRVLRDALVLQAAMRACRKMEGKSRTFILDASHRAEMSEELRKAARAYGAPTSSNYSPAQVVRELDSRRQRILAIFNLRGRTGRGLYQRYESGELGAEGLTEEARAWKEEHPYDYVPTRRLLGGYLATLRMGEQLQYLEPRHRDDKFKSFVEGINNYLWNEEGGRAAAEAEVEEIMATQTFLDSSDNEKGEDGSEGDGTGPEPFEDPRGDEEEGGSPTGGEGRKGDREEEEREDLNDQNFRDLEHLQKREAVFAAFFEEVEKLSRDVNRDLYMKGMRSHIEGKDPDFDGPRLLERLVLRAEMLFRRLDIPGVPEGMKEEVLAPYLQPNRRDIRALYLKHLEIIEARMAEEN